MKIFFVGAALLISVLSTDAQRYSSDLPPPWTLRSFGSGWSFKHFGSAENPGFKDDVLFGNSIPQISPSGPFRRFGSTWPSRRFDSERPFRPFDLERLFRRFDSDWPSRRYGSERPFRRYDSERPSRFGSERSFRRFDSERPFRPFDLERLLRRFDLDWLFRRFGSERPFRRYGSERPFRRYDSEWPSRRSGSERPFRRYDSERSFRRFDLDWLFRRSGSERPFRRYDSERSFRRYDSDWPFRRSGSEWPFRRRFGSEKSRFRDDTYLLKSILRQSLLRLFRPLGLARNPGFLGDVSFRNSIPGRLPFWFPRSFGSAWPFRHFGSSDRFRSEKLVHMLGKLIEICKKIFDGNRPWEPRGSPLKIIPSVKVSCGNRVNTQRRRPRLPPYGYFGFPQGNPFYPQGFPFYPQGYPRFPQGYPEVGTALPSSPAAMQPFGSAFPPYHPPPFYPGVASPGYLSTQQPNYWNPPNPALNRYPGLVPPEPFPAQPLPPAQPQTGYVPSVLYSPQKSSGAALFPPPQYALPPLAQRAPYAFANPASPAPPPRSRPASSLRYPPDPPPRARPASSLRYLPDPPPRARPAPPPLTRPAPPLRPRSALTRAASSVARSPDTSASTDFDLLESDASEALGSLDRKTSTLKGKPSQKSPRNKPQTTKDLTELDF